MTDAKTCLALAIAAVTAGMAHAHPARACSPMPAVMFQDYGTLQNPLLASDGTVVVRALVNQDPVHLEEIELRVHPVDAPDVSVAGEWELRDLRGDGYDHAFVWRAHEELGPGDYELVLGHETGDRLVFHHLGEGADAELDVDVPRLKMDERPSSERNCCDVAACEPPVYVCGGSVDDACRSCWPARYQYHPRLSVDLAHVDGSYLLRVYRASQNEEERLMRVLPLTREVERIALDFPEDAVGPYCMRLEIERLRDDEIVIDSGAICAGDEMMEPFETRRPDNREAMAACDSLPDDPQDPHWQEFAEAYDVDALPPSGSPELEDHEPRRRRAAPRLPNLACAFAGPNLPSAPLQMLPFLMVVCWVTRRRRCASGS